MQSGPQAPIDVEMVDGQAPSEPSPAQPATSHTEQLTNGNADPTIIPTPTTNIEVPVIAAPPTTITPAQVLSAPPAPRPLPRVYEVDLDKMQFKLYDKDSGYLTPSDVLNDLGRIVHNTRIEPCNIDHVLKAHQMYSDFEAIIWEPQFVRDCEQMANRQRARRAGAKGEQEKAGAPKVATPDVASQSQPNGRGSPGAEMQISERGLKRQRGETESSPDPGVGTAEGSFVKRAKLSTPPAQSHGPVPSGPTEPSYGPQGMNLHFSSSSSLPGMQPSAFAGPSHTPPVAHSPVILPDFILNEYDFSTLRSRLEHDTAPLSVEQLEELRAMLLDRVWRRRADWDRSHMLKDMENAVTEYFKRPNVSLM